MRKRGEKREKRKQREQREQKDRAAYYSSLGRILHAHLLPPVLRLKVMFFLRINSMMASSLIFLDAIAAIFVEWRFGQRVGV
jgi:hypothetical protein